MIPLICLALAVAGGLWLWLQRLQAGQVRDALTAQLTRRPLLTNAEAEFLPILEAALPEFRIFAQVAMGALITTKRGIGQAASMRARNSFSRKILDFVICSRVDGQALLIVELDDSSHDSDTAKQADRLRDAMTLAAGYPTVRVSNRPWPNAAIVRAKVLPTIELLKLAA